MAFVLDQLLPQCQTAGDKDCPALARIFLASIASCTHCPEAQTTLVAEVKAALQRALGLPESGEKHSRVQAVMGIISTIIEACPNPPGSVPNSVSAASISVNTCWRACHCIYMHVGLKAYIFSTVTVFHALAYICTHPCSYAL